MAAPQRSALGSSDTSSVFLLRETFGRDIEGGRKEPSYQKPIRSVVAAKRADVRADSRNTEKTVI